MGERRLLEIVTMEELIEMKCFNSVSEIYNTPDEILPRVRRAGKIVRPLRFYLKDVERYEKIIRDWYFQQQRAG